MRLCFISVSFLLGAELKSLVKVQKVELDENAITSLPAEIFKDFQATTENFRLSLKHNRMSYIHSRAFAHVSKLRLESLNLQGNRLTGLDFLADPCSLAFTLEAFVGVRDNPINCDCDVYSAVVSAYVQVDGKCTEPPKYAQMWLNHGLNRDFLNEAGAECREVTNVTEVVTCARDASLAASFRRGSLTFVLVSGALSVLCALQLSL